MSQCLNPCAPNTPANVRPNTLAMMIAELSFDELQMCYYNIVQFRETGLLDTNAKLRDIHAMVNDRMEHQDLRKIEDAVLLEMSRRYLNMCNGVTAKPLSIGDDIYYLYDDTGEIEKGVITSLSYKSHELTGIGVEFDNDGDEFNGDALGKYLFTTEEDAMTAYQNQ